MTVGQIDSGAGHPLLTLVEELGERVDAVGSAPVWTLTPRQLVEALPRLEVEIRRLEAIRTAMLREADRHQVGDPNGFGSTAGWWSAVTRATKPQARRQVALAERLDRDEHGATRDAVAVGAVSLDQAAVIVRCVEDLPQDLVDAGLRAKAEHDLVALAEHHDPRELRILGRRILEVEAPQIAEEAERRILEAEEQHAAATASFTMRPDGHGSMLGRFKIPVLAGRMLEKHLKAIVAPRHQNAVAAATGTVPQPWRWGTAFTEYVETREAQRTPKAGGVAATVVVTMTLDSLLGGIKAASLDSGDRISAAEARRIACGAGIIPAVLGTRSQVLDLGRRTRFHTEPQRIAVALRDKTCIVEDCGRGPEDCHVHHPHAWSHGGGTSVTNGVLICGRHHTLAHDERYQQQSRPNGRIRFVRRT